MVFRPWMYPHYIDLRQPLDGLTERVVIEQGHNFSLQPGQFVLGTTLEYFEIPNDMMARLEGKSSLGRVGLLIHATAGYVDPGFKGRLTLELSNVATLPIILYPTMKISQISFHRLTTPADRPYGSPGLGSKYQGQLDPTPTRFHQEFGGPSLLSLPSIPTKKPVTAPAPGRNELREWLKESNFKGSVRRFAEALDVKMKTVEDWIYRDAKPSQRYCAKLFSLTGLPQFKTASEGTTRELAQN
jgi:dCTP deaminase